MTNYVILKKDPNLKDASLWEQLTAQYARSAKAAIQNVVDETGVPGVYIAVPARSWRQHTVEVEQKTALKFS